MTDQLSINHDLYLQNHFEFGNNWAKLVTVISEDKLQSAIDDIESFIYPLSISGRSFLDIGCGSGLHAIAAWRLGAREIITVDIDPKSRELVDRLKKAFNVPVSFPWTHFVGNIATLDGLDKIPPCDVVYSWGVLHHTGDMWSSLKNALSFVSEQGCFYTMLYRDAYLASFWKFIKKTYVFGPSWLRKVLRVFFVSVYYILMLVKHRSFSKVNQRIRDYGKSSRGMSWYIDIVDWIGGYPFEWASASQVCDCLSAAGFQLRKINPEISPKKFGVLGTGSYQYFFVRN